MLSQNLMSKKLAGMTPIWEPGTASGYHSMTFGWLTSELILRVTGKSLGTFFREEVGDQHEIDFFTYSFRHVQPKIINFSIKLALLLRLLIFLP